MTAALWNAMFPQASEVEPLSGVGPAATLMNQPELGIRSSPGPPAGGGSVRFVVLVAVPFACSGDHSAGTVYVADAIVAGRSAGLISMLTVKTHGGTHEMSSQVPLKVTLWISSVFRAQTTVSPASMVITWG